MPRKSTVQRDPGPRRPLQILLAEDCRADVALVRKALASVQVPTELTVVDNGDQLLQYLVDALNLEDQTNALPFPDVVLVDLNMPKLDGFKALELISAQNGGYTLPLVVISSTAKPEDRRLARDLGANGFIDKALGPSEFIQQLQFIERLALTSGTIVSKPSARRH
ncbi:MAG: CheY-like chemotaxis protein [Bermanella sp.]|jgi:CheY-like chemotaxis protein